MPIRYQHKIYNLSAIDKKLQERLNSFQNSDVIFRYEQSLDWFQSCKNDNFEILITFSKEAVVASSVIRRVSYPFINKFKFIVQSGPVYSDFDALSSHIKYLITAHSNNAIEIRLSPCFKRSNREFMSKVIREAGFCAVKPENSIYTSTVVVDLKVPKSKIKSSYSASLRRHLRKDKIKGIRVKAADCEGDVLAFVNAVIPFYKARGVGVVAADILKSYINKRVLIKGQGLVLFADIGGINVAGIFVDIIAGRAVYNYGYSSDNPEVKSLPLSHMMHDEAIQWAYMNGCYKYDFGGYNSVKPDDGINRFKLGFSKNIEGISENYLFINDSFLRVIIQMKSALSAYLKLFKKSI
jgi:lipid II:glycine glycyltransferase (peptidoglycan interpeptide bridge formation enzyme)